MKLIHKAKGQAVKLLLRVLPIHTPVVFTGQNSIRQLCDQLAILGIERVLIVTDSMLRQLGSLEEAENTLLHHEISYVVYDGVLPDPSFNQVQDAYDEFLRSDCQAVLSIGGGSVIDVGKVVSMMATNPQRKLSKMEGIQRFRKPGVPHLVAPTTSGTGSEASIGAVISAPETHVKAVIGDAKLTPGYVALDTNLLKSMPPSVTAATGMDALTHAVESYISNAATRQSQDQAATAVRLIMTNLLKAYKNGNDLAARDAMALAAFKAALAFNRSSLGYVHALAHQIGHYCGTPHGVANSMFLPEVLSVYGEIIHPQLAELARICDIEGNSESDLARAFISRIVALRAELNLPLAPAEFREEWIRPVLKAAVAETGNFYPVPRYMSKRELSPLVSRFLATDAA